MLILRVSSIWLPTDGRIRTDNPFFIYSNKCLVADTLEAEWNNKLRSLAEAQERYEQQTQSTDLRCYLHLSREILQGALHRPALRCASQRPVAAAQRSFHQLSQVLGRVWLLQKTSHAG